MKEKQVEGIILKSIPFKESDRILSLFTKELGIISLFVKKLSQNRPAQVNLTTPLCRGEFLFRRGNSDLCRFIDGSILDLHLPLRRSYQRLEYGGKMVQAIAATQMPEKPAPALYQLLLCYLKQLETFAEPATLWASFQLKLLKHEGLIALDMLCQSCNAAKALRLVDGESRCIECASGMSFPFTEKQWKTLLVLFSTKQFDTLNAVEVDSPFMQSIEALFHSSLAQ